MKKLVLGFALGVLAVVLLGAVGGSGDLEIQLQRPEAQKALNNYIQQHCNSSVDRTELARAEKGEITNAYVRTFCWSADPTTSK